ncbi:MAG: recombinase zinc beta ribbon domain-containing protein, partial [Bryobacterales bacterium]|nr:recombinase zinc beta ribbon domain-containing protein [Bryobacterales bacterium]
VCGEMMCPGSTTKPSTGKTYRFYRCSRREKYGKDQCAGRPLPAPALEEFVVARISNATADGSLAKRVEKQLEMLTAGKGEAFGKLRTADIAVPGDVATSLKALGAARSTCDEWRKRCMGNRERFGFRYDAPGTDIYAPGLLKRLSEVAPADAIIACDVGQHQMWAAQLIRFNEPRLWLNSGGLGSMGFG